MFIDKVDLYIKAGNGGNGAVSFRREKYVAKGGPDGGDGGRGGDIIFKVDDGENTLFAFKSRRKFSAGNGDSGQGRKFHGKNGENLIITVPRGTIIKEKSTGRIIHDMSDGADFIALKGGKGGWGNKRFATATRQVPFFAKSGRPGNEIEITLELKMIADVGIIGYPNVGKSTLLSAVSAANPKIANYHFTTLSPNLGVISQYERSFIMADIPGLIEGASEGQGLGHNFLRHIERCRLLLHIFDISSSERADPLADIKKINSELEKFNPELLERPHILAGNKIDEGYSEENLEKIKKFAKKNRQPLFLISAAIGEGVEELMDYIVKSVRELPPPVVFEPEYVEFSDYDIKDIEVNINEGVYHVTGGNLERLCNDVNFDDRESLQYFQRALLLSGVINALEKSGINEGDTVDIYGIEFEFFY